MLKNVKIIILIITAFIIIGLVILTVAYKIKDLTPFNRNGRLAADSRGAITQSVPAGNMEYCKKFDGDKKDECIYGTANSINNNKLCEQIKSEELKNKCQERFIYNDIMQGDDARKCSSLIYYGEQCYNDFFWKWDDLSKCAEFKDDIKNLCKDIINNKLAFKNSDISYCQKIKNDIAKSNCEAIVAVKPKDSDNDGLLDSDEIAYGTDPFNKDTDGDGLGDLKEMSEYFTDPKNADTDGDGYLDGEEAENGYNPKGEGKLSKLRIKNDE